MKKVNVKEGDWVAVPLRADGFGVGLVARKGRRGVLFGYFFGLKFDKPPELDVVRTLGPEMSAFCRRFGDLGIRCGAWPILGRLHAWDRSVWPMPEFGRIDEATGLAWSVRYPNEDPSEHGEAQKTSIEHARNLPPGGLLGSGAVEILLTQKLGG